MAGYTATKALRIAQLLDLLNKKSPYGGVSINEMAKALEVSTRSIHRYLDHIENDLGKPVVRPERNTSGEKGLYRLDAGYLPSISPEKALVILLSLLQQKGSALAGHTNELKDALIGTLFKYKYNPQTLPAEKLQDRIHIVDEQLAEPEKVGRIFSRLVQSLRDCCRVKVWYYVAHSGLDTQRVVEPYGLICKSHNWYLVANCLKRGAVRVFRVDQITDIFPYTSERFEIPAGFSLKEYMGQSWGIINDGEVCRVRLRFSSRVAHRVKRLIYHPSQRIEDAPLDGSVILSFEVCGLDEIKTWLVQWGDHVEVLEPSWLRQDMYEMARRVLEIYKA